MVGCDIAARFEEIYAATEKAVLRHITAKCVRTADIGDIFQDTYLEIYQALLKRGAEYVSNEQAFAMRIARQKLSKYYSIKDRLKALVFMPAGESDDDRGCAEMEIADAFLTDEFVVDKIMLETARQFVESKPELVKKAFYLYYELGMKISEIADELSISESNAKNKIYRTLRELRELLERRGGQNEGQ